MQIHLINTRNFTARGIQLFMRIHCLIRFKKQPTIIYNHAAIYDEVTNMIYEADYPTVAKIPYDDWKNIKKNKKATVKVMPVKFTYVDNKQIKSYLENQIGKKYELMNFWWHIVKVFTGIWFGARTEKKFYCYELVIRALNATDKFNEDVYMNPYQFYEKFVK